MPLDTSLGESLSVQNPYDCQRICYFTFLPEDAWKINKWRQILLVFAQDQHDFFVSPEELHQRVNLCLQRHQAFHAVELSTVEKVFRALHHAGVIVPLNDILLWFDQVFDHDKIVNRFHSSQQHQTTLSKISRWLFARHEDGSNIPKEIRLPPRVAACDLTPITSEETCVVLPMIIPMLRDYVKDVMSGVLPSVAVGDGFIVTADDIKNYLSTQNKRLASPRHVKATLWVLTFCTDYGARVFYPNANKSAMAVKIPIVPADDITVTAADKAAVAEATAIKAITEHIASCEERAAQADKECKAFLSQGNRDCALTCLKKKKMLEEQVLNLQNHLLKLEETRCLREGGQSVGLVVSVLQAGASTTKQLIDQDVVMDVLDNLQETADDLQRVQAQMKRLTLDGEDDDELIAEYNRLVESEKLEVLPPSVIRDSDEDREKVPL